VIYLLFKRFLSQSTRVGSSPAEAPAVFSQYELNVMILTFYDFFPIKKFLRPFLLFTIFYFFVQKYCTNFTFLFKNIARIFSCQKYLRPFALFTLFLNICLLKLITRGSGCLKMLFYMFKDAVLYVSLSLP
jgi:hypothetical protein